jgi:hypothetical protein
MADLLFNSNAYCSMISFFYNAKYVSSFCTKYVGVKKINILRNINKLKTLTSKQLPMINDGLS